MGDTTLGYVLGLTVGLLVGFCLGVVAQAGVEHERESRACLATKCAVGEPLYVESRCVCAVDAGAK